jgi:hypothetical protein
VPFLLNLAYDHATVMGSVQLWLLGMHKHPRIDESEWTAYLHHKKNLMRSQYGFWSGFRRDWPKAPEYLHGPW